MLDPGYRDQGKITAEEHALHRGGRADLGRVGKTPVESDGLSSWGRLRPAPGKKGRARGPTCRGALFCRVHVKGRYLAVEGWETGRPLTRGFREEAVAEAASS
jgi:hypothetical protein